MAAPAAIRKYLYWSDRRISAIVADTGLRLSAPVKAKVTTPQVPFAPQVEVEGTGRGPSRDHIAERLQRYLSGVTVADFVTPPPVRFATGRGTVTFAEFINMGEREDIVSMFAETTTTAGTRVAVCMFGSRDNLADVIGSSPTTSTGWSSSAAPFVHEFIASEGKTVDAAHDDYELALETLNLILHQGGDRSGVERRGFTYGHVSSDAEWLLEAYWDHEFGHHPDKDNYGYDRVIIGAPIWVRTPEATPIALYGDPALDRGRPGEPPVAVDRRPTRRSRWGTRLWD